MENLQLVVHMHGATPEELQRAGEAAMAVFARYEVTPLEAAEAEFAREGYDESGFDPDYEGYTQEQAAIAHVWGEAARAAAVACCADWPPEAKPERARMEVVGFAEDDDEPDDDDEMRAMFRAYLASQGVELEGDKFEVAYQKSLRGQR